MEVGSLPIFNFSSSYTYHLGYAPDYYGTVLQYTDHIWMDKKIKDYIISLETMTTPQQREREHQKNIRKRRSTLRSSRSLKNPYSKPRQYSKTLLPGYNYGGGRYRRKTLKKIRKTKK